MMGWALLVTRPRSSHFPFIREFSLSYPIPSFRLYPP
jgi:hypothetical protein